MNGGKLREPGARRIPRQQVLAAERFSPIRRADSETPIFVARLHRHPPMSRDEFASSALSCKAILVVNDSCDS
jgi:hypothetical protein